VPVPEAVKSRGRILRVLLSSLQRGGYRCFRRQYVGPKPGGGRQYVDILAERGEKRYLISLKWRQAPGSTEQTLVFEVICLLEAVRREGQRAYLILEGPGWSMREFYFRELGRYLREEKVVILSLKEFLARAERGRL
jgi:hypothetical protein